MKFRFARKVRNESRRNFKKSSIKYECTEYHRCCIEYNQVGKREKKAAIINWEWIHQFKSKRSSGRQLSRTGSQPLHPDFPLFLKWHEALGNADKRFEGWRSSAGWKRTIAIIAIYVKLITILRQYMQYIELMYIIIAI